MNRKLNLPIRRRRGREAGSAAVEFALVTLPVILIILGAFDYFAASYETTTLEGAARAVAEYARNAPVCTGGLGNTNCTSSISTLFSAMQQNNNSLSGASQTTATYYTCPDNTSTTSSGPCNVSGDTRIVQYIQVTVTEPWLKIFSWDPWSSTSPLTARMSMRIQ
jgi:Flp pilus assembly protein TadG